MVNKAFAGSTASRPAMSIKALLTAKPVLDETGGAGLSETMA
jgi:hypothetical protein